MARAYTSLELDSPPCELVADLEVNWSSESTERSRVPPWSRLSGDAPEAAAVAAPKDEASEQPQPLSKVQLMAKDGGLPANSACNRHEFWAHKVVSSIYVGCKGLIRGLLSLKAAQVLSCLETPQVPRYKNWNDTKWERLRTFKAESKW